MKQVEVAGVRLEVPSNQPVVLLREEESTRFVPIWIGSSEASAILLTLESIDSPRPLTHDLFVQVLNVLADPIKEVWITRVDDGVFYATIQLTSGEEIDARPSDALALALRSNARILMAEEVLEQAGVELDDDALTVLSQVGEATGESASTEGGDAEKELREFREFLADVSPDDFQGDQDPPDVGKS